MTKKDQKTNKMTPESNLFKDAMQGVRPLNAPKKVSLKPKEKTSFRPSPHKPLNKSKEMNFSDELSDYESLVPVSPEDKLEFAKSGIQNKTLRNLRQGKYNVQAILDLHSKTVDEARQSLSKFLQRCSRQGIGIVLIIHGKGRGDKPILKNKINHWLRQIDTVNAFCSANVREGHTGAVYVMLRTGSISQKKRG